MRRMSNISVFHFLLLLSIFQFNSIYSHVEIMNKHQMQIPVPVGVVLDVKNSSFDAMIKLCIDMAISDFYASSSHSSYETRLQLINKDADNALDQNLAVLELVKHEQVMAILGSLQETFAAAVGEAALVPIVSFTARSSSFSYTRNNYHIRTALDDAVQAEALAAICGRFGWSEAVIFYEDTESGNQFLSHTVKAFQDAEIRLTYMASIPLSAGDTHIQHELDMVNAKQTRVFLVHANHVLGSRLFALANAAGMMSEGYAWVVTDSISIFLNSIDSETRDSMDGVMGIRPYEPASKTLKSFRDRWKASMLTSKVGEAIMDLNIYGLWAYDTVTVLAVTVENAKHVDSSFSSFGSRLVGELSKTKFGGLVGEFELVEGKLKGCVYEIFNIIGNGEKRVGFWSLDRGITREVSGESKNGVRKVVWPGDSVTQPKGWSIPPTGSLRVGLPWSSGFTQFVDVLIDPATNVTHATGFAVDVFIQALNQLPFPLNYTFHGINTREFSSVHMLLQNKIKEFDIIVADITIWAPRADYVDFSLPYSESGIVLVVKNKKPFDMWIFVRPLRWDLWLAILVASMLMGIVLCILENQGPGPIYWSPIANLAFPDRNMVSNNWSVFVLVCWLFMAFVLMQSFTANLSAILTLDQLRFSFSEDYYVGYHEGSFMRKFLTDNLNTNEANLRGYTSVQGLHEGMCKGSKNGGIDAIFDELPYMKLLLNRYKSQYKIVGPTYNTDGFGFAFPPESPLVRHFSKAILNVTQGPYMNEIEQKNLGPGYSSQDPLSSIISQGTSSLALQKFAGLFLVTGSFVLLALFCSKTSIGRKLTHIIQSCLTSTTPLPPSTDSAGDTTLGGSNHESTHSNASPPPGEGSDAQVTREEATQISETATENASTSAAQYTAEGNENEPSTNRG